MPLAADRTYRYLTDAQADLIATLVNARFDEDDPQRQPWRERFSQIRTNSDVSAMIEELRALPTLAQREQDRRDALRPTEEGLYLDKATGKLYRLRKVKFDTIVSVYSKTAARRLTVDNKVVEPGTWKRLSAWDSRMTLNRGDITKDMLMTDEEKVEYQTGICNFCYRGLEDAESVARNYGPKCATKHGLPYGGLAGTLATS